MKKNKVSKPIKVKFYTKSGEKIAFRPNRKVGKPIKVDFYEITSHERNFDCVDCKICYICLICRKHHDNKKSAKECNHIK